MFNLTQITLNKKPWLSSCFLIVSSLLSACNSDDNNTPEISITATTAVVQTVASDYSSSQVAYIDIETQDITEGFNTKEKSGYTISSDGTNIYHIGQFNIDTIDKFSSENPATSVWSYSTNEEGQATSSNTYSLIPHSDTKAYLIHYGLDSVWIVNPQATTFEEFKTGELDLSSYSPANNTETPRASAGIIVDDKLFITMQRLSSSWEYNNTAYVAVFDTETDTEIETNSDTSDSVKGIALNGLNPLNHSLSATEDFVYVTSKSSYSTDDLAQSMVEAINVDTYAKRQVITALNITDNTSGFISASAIISDELGYFILNSYDSSWNADDQVYAFNPTTGVINQTNITNYTASAISFITTDTDNNLWVSVADSANPGIDVYDTSDNSLLYNRIATTLNPGAIVFITAESE